MRWVCSCRVCARIYSDFVVMGWFVILWCSVVLVCFWCVWTMLKMVRELFALLMAFVCVSVSFGCPWSGENIEYFCLSLGLSLIAFSSFFVSVSAC